MKKLNEKQIEQVEALFKHYGRVEVSRTEINNLSKSGAIKDPGWLKTDLGGPEAPGEPEDGGQRMWEICSLPWDETGKFWHGNQEIEF